MMEKTGRPWETHALILPALPPRTRDHPGRTLHLQHLPARGFSRHPSWLSFHLASFPRVSDDELTTDPFPTRHQGAHVPRPCTQASPTQDNSRTGRPPGSGHSLPMQDRANNQKQQTTSSSSGSEPPVCSFPLAAVKYYHKFSDLKQYTSYSHPSEGRQNENHNAEN